VVEHDKDQSRMDSSCQLAGQRATAPTAVADSIKFLRLLLSDCGEGANEHGWRECPRCLAFDLLQNRDRTALRLIKSAVKALECR